MKKETHPDYHRIKVVMTDGTEFVTYSTYGAEGDTLKLDIDPKTHPAWTGGGQHLIEFGAGEIPATHCNAIDLHRVADVVQRIRGQQDQVRPFAGLDRSPLA